MYKRPVFKILFKRISEPRRFIQVLAGPRQSGKTTLARQLMDVLDIPCHYVTADEPVLKDLVWIEQQWETIRTRLKRTNALVLYPKNLIFMYYEGILPYLLQCF